LTKRRKRLAFIATSAISLNQLMRGQLEFLRSSGVDLDLYCGGPNDQLAMLKERCAGRVCYVPFRREPHLFWDVASLLWLIVRLALNRYDAVIYSTPKAMLLGSLAASITLQRYRIAWVRGRGYENFRGRKRRIYAALDRLTFRLSDEVLFVSRSLQAAYSKDGVDPGAKGKIVGFGSSNGVDLHRFRPLGPAERSMLRRDLDLTDKDFVIAVVGRIRRDKGSEEVLNLARRMKDVANLRILMVGMIEESGIEKKLRRIRGGLVRWYPSSQSVERYFQVADLHLFLSHREGFGNVAIEAAAVGVPTFGFNVVGVRDSVVADRTGAFFDFGDIAGLETAIRAAVKDPAKLKKRFANARATVDRRFAQARVWDEYARIFLQENPSEATEVPSLPGSRPA
jgi:glycosyltransferase involved in cell wall biosynthesis